MSQKIFCGIKRIACAIVLILIAAGCGSGPGPVSPETNNAVFKESRQPSQNSRMLWGFWEVTIDPDTMEVSINELRSAQFNANVTRFLQPPASPIHLMTVSIDGSASNIPKDLLAIDVTIRHPFIALKQFRGFDVRGIFMANFSKISGYDNSALYANWSDAQATIPTTEPVLLNADGYTRWWNPNEFTNYGIIFGYTHGHFAPKDFLASATVNPFKYFSDELGSKDPFILDPYKRGTFGTSPGVNTRRYLIQFDKKPWKYNYAIDASWAKPDASGAPDYPVESFPPEANCQEAYKITLENKESTAWFFGPGSYGGEFVVDIEIFDWQADTTANPDSILDEISSIWIESPAFDDGSGNQYLNILDGAYEVLPGSSFTSAVVRAHVGANFNPGGISSSGPYPVFITVESEYPDTYEPQIDGGGTMFDYPDAPLAAYATGFVNVSGTSPDYPEVLSIIPDKGKVDSVLTDVEIHGKNFMDGASVTLDHVSGTYSIGPLTTSFVDSTNLLFDLDLNGATLGFYNVTVKNPDTKSGVLPSGFEVTEDLIPVLVLENEIAFEPYHASFENYSPAICVEIDNDIVFAFEEYHPSGNTSYASARRSKDDGNTWPDATSSFISYGGTWRHGDAVKIWPASYGTSYRTLQLADPSNTIWATGFLGTTFNDSGQYPDGAHVTQNIDRFTELLQDADKYVYTLGDKGGYIHFKRSEVPEYITGGPSGAIWSSFPVYTLANPGTLSRARSSALYNGFMYLAYYEIANKRIKLAKASNYQNWNTSTVIWDGSSAPYTDVRDPGLHLDETGFHVSFVRAKVVDTNVYELCYTYSSNGNSWTEPVVIRKAATAMDIKDSPIIRYDWDGVSTLGVVWWENTSIYAAFSVNDGKSWSDPVLVSETYPQNKQPDLVISPTDNWHFVFASLNTTTNLYEIHYRRGHMEWQ